MASVEKAPEGNWSDDLLGRQADSELLIRFLTNRVAERKRQGLKGSYVLNLDARYGEGKSFFITRFERDLARDHAVAYVNAWEDDHAEDPLIPLIAAIDKSFAGAGKKVKDAAKSLMKKGGEVAVIATKHALITAGKKYLGEGANEIAKVLGADGKGAEDAVDKTIEEIVGKDANVALAKFKSAKKTIEAFKAQLRKLLELDKTRKPLFVLIDELDRCRPTYAISLLERVKHLFDTDDVVFVISTDTEQLRHAVGAVYGAGFDSSGYLLRFFNRTYRFAEPAKANYIQFLFATYEIPADRLSSPLEDKHIEFFVQIAELFKLTLREIDSCFDMLRSVVTNWRWPHQLKIELALLLPLIAFYTRGNMEQFRRLASLTPTDLPKTSVPGIRYHHRFDRGIQEKSIGVSSLIEEFVNFARTPLPEIRMDGTEQRPQEWIRRRLLGEYSIVHRNTFGSGRGPRSVCAEYGEIVRAVGRLTIDST